MLKFIILLVSVGFAIAFFLALPSGSQEVDPAEKNCAVLIDTGCTECHYKTRICQVLGKKSKRKWRRTIKNMIRYGAVFTKEQIDILTSCLHATPPKADYICAQPLKNKDTP